MKQKQTKPKPDPLIPSFRGLNIVDDQGRIRMSLGVEVGTSGFGPTLSLFDAEGNAKFVIGVNDAEPSTKLLIAGPDGKQQIGIGVDEMGAAIMLGDPGGQMRAAFACELGYPSMQIYDAEERLRIVAAETPDGMRLEVLDEAGEPVWSHNGKA